MVTENAIPNPDSAYSNWYRLQPSLCEEEQNRFRRRGRSHYPGWRYGGIRRFCRRRGGQRKLLWNWNGTTLKPANRVISP